MKKLLTYYLQFTPTIPTTKVIKSWNEAELTDTLGGLTKDMIIPEDIGQQPEIQKTEIPSLA